MNSLTVKPSSENNNPERKVITYTTTNVVKIFIENKSKSFHLNIANRMNYSSEGQTLFKLIGCNQDESAMNDVYGFLTSFTFNRHSLNQFRLYTYGNTNYQDGSGVSFVVSIQLFSPENSYNNVKIKSNIPDTMSLKVTDSGVKDKNTKKTNH